MRIQPTCATLCLLALSLPLSAQQNSAPDASNPTLTIKTDSSLVNLPLVVRDKRGALVKTLSKDDLVLTEDGKPQTIRYFDRDVDLPLTLGLLVDVSLSQRDVLDEERAASQTFLQQMLGAQDKAFVVQFAREVDLLSDPTSSRATLQAALAKLSTMPQQSDSSGGTDQSSDSQAHVRHGGTQLYDAIFLASDEVIKKQPTRKALILLTDGVDSGSMETLVQSIEAAQRADTIVYAIYFKGDEPQQHRGFDNSGGDHGHGGRSGGGWPGGGGGWPGGGGGGAPGQGGGGNPHGNDPHEHEERVDGRKILDRITFETGGTLFEVSKKQTVADIYGQIAEELRNQFRLGYTPPKHDGAGFHEVLVTPKDKKLSVQTRSGYYSDK